MATIPEPPLPIPNLIWQTLFSRGVETPADIDRYLRPSLKSLRSPLTMADMKKAAERVVEAFQKQQSICIYADFDLDGTSGLALLKTGLEKLGFQRVTGYQPRRLAEGYGVHVNAVREIRQSGAELMITVDVGTTAREALAEAAALGLEVIVTDHHLPQGEWPTCYALVNPNRGDCPSELQHLAGAGVAFYLLLAVRQTLKESGTPFNDFDPKELLDFLVIGTVTDMVPLKDENRVLVRHGLFQLGQTKRAGLRALLDRLELSGRDLTSHDLAMKFAPKLNALSRLESDIRPIDMMLATDKAEADQLAHRVLELNQQRVELQKSAENEAREILQESPPESAIFVWSKNFHRGVVGLVATRLAQDFGLPAFVGSVDEEGRIIGSARLPRGEIDVSLVRALESAQNFLVKFGGHAQAAGFECTVENAHSVRFQLNEYFRVDNSGLAEGSTVIFYDGEDRLTSVNSEFMRWLEGLGPFGADFDPPVFLLRDAQIAEVKELKGGHLRFGFTAAGLRQKIQGIWFSPPLGWTDAQLVPGARVELLAEPSWNHFMGQKTLQLQIKAIRTAITP